MLIIKKMLAGPMSRSPILSILLLALGAATQAGAQDLSPLFQSLEPVNITLTAPFQKVNRARGEKRPEYPATLTMANADGSQVSLDLEIRTRGHFRAKKEVCSYPPLRLDFKRKSLDGSIFDGENNLKLAVQCKSSDSYEQFIYLEYLTYRVYQLFSDYSLKVRLARVTYIDSEKNKDEGTRLAFFIEDVGHMAKRLGLKEVEAQRLRPADYDPAIMNLVDVFQFFIGNTDWSAFAGPPGEGCCHNIIPLSQGPGRMVPVPYDFDTTGAVDPSYAQVSDQLPIRSVTQRLFRGICQDRTLYDATIARFMEKRQAIQDLYVNQAGLSDRSRREALEFFDEFYQIITDEAKLQKEIIDDCRG